MVILLLSFNTRTLEYRVKHYVKPKTTYNTGTTFKPTSYYKVCAPPISNYQGVLHLMCVTQATLDNVVRIYGSIHNLPGLEEMNAKGLLVKWQIAED